MKKLVIIGAGDLSLDLVENIERDKLYKIHGFIDEKKKGMYCGYPILSKDINDVKNAEKYCYFVSIADNKSRKEIIDILLRKKLNVVSIICKDSFISKHAKIGKNVYIGKRVTINANAYIGNNNIIRDNCYIAHGSFIENNCYISPCCCLAGNVQIGQSSFVGINTTVKPNVKIGKINVIGAGAVVINDTENNKKIAGVPAKELI